MVATVESSKEVVESSRRVLPKNMLTAVLWVPGSDLLRPSKKWAQTAENWCVSSSTDVSIDEMAAHSTVQQ